MRRMLLLLCLTALSGCATFESIPVPEIKMENLVYVPANLVLDRIDDYATQGHFPKINKPLLSWGPLSLSTSFRARFDRKYYDEDPADPNLQPLGRDERRDRDGARFSGASTKIDFDRLYVELKFKF